MKYLMLLSLLCGNIASVAECAHGPDIQLNQYLDKVEGYREWNGVVLVADKGRILLERGTISDSISALNYTPETAFPLASLTKVLTATAVLQLVEAGKLRLNHPVANILNTFPYKRITVRHLLTHTSGLPPYNAFCASVLAAHPDTIFTNTSVQACIETNPLPLMYEPGNDSNYDNINYLVLAFLVERASGISYQDYISRNILAPAAMHHTRMMHLGDLLKDSTQENVAVPWIYPHLYSSVPVSAATLPFVVSYWNTYRLLGFSEYVSTAGDLFRFDRALAEGRLVSDKTLDSAFRPFRLSGGKKTEGPFGLGWEIDRDTTCGRIVLHTGFAVGLSTVMIRNLSKDQVVVVFDNGHNTAKDIGMAMMRLMNGVSAALPKRNLATFLGRALVTQGATQALAGFRELLSDTISWRITEDDINLLGYDLLGRPGPYRLPVIHRYDDALIVFKLNTELYANSWNVWDSYGEALAMVGRNGEAIEMYRKAIRLNPESKTSQRMLQKLLSDGGSRRR